MMPSDVQPFVLSLEMGSDFYLFFEDFYIVNYIRNRNYMRDKQINTSF